MPDLVSIALGGGTRIHRNGSLRLGPDSVGYRITADALVFGGDTLTLSDVAVAAELATMGDPSRVNSLDRSLVSAVLTRVRVTCEDVIDRLKTSADPIPVVLVGGGSVVVPADLAPASEILRPANYDVANAIGAAIAQCSGEIDRVFSLDQHSRAEALDIAKQMAVDEAVRAGADAQTVEIIDIQEVPMAYLPSSAIQIRIRAAGDLVLA